MEGGSLGDRQENPPGARPNIKRQQKAGPRAAAGAEVLSHACHGKGFLAGCTVSDGLWKGHGCRNVWFNPGISPACASGPRNPSYTRVIFAVDANVEPIVEVVVEVAATLLDRLLTEVFKLPTVEDNEL